MACHISFGFLLPDVVNWWVKIGFMFCGVLYGFGKVADFGQISLTVSLLHPDDADLYCSIDIMTTLLENYHAWLHDDADKT